MTYRLVRAKVETAADAWWDSLTKKQQDSYIKLHPNSKYGKKKGKAPEAPKTKAKPSVLPKGVKHSKKDQDFLSKVSKTYVSPYESYTKPKAKPKVSPEDKTRIAALKKGIAQIEKDILKQVQEDKRKDLPKSSAKVFRLEQRKDSMLMRLNELYEKLGISE